MPDQNTIRLIKSQQNIMYFSDQKDFTVEEFEKRVLIGDFTDDNCEAQLIINDELREEFVVSISRRVVSKLGSVVSLSSLEKSFGKDNIVVHCEPKIYL